MSRMCGRFTWLRGSPGKQPPVRNFVSGNISIFWRLARLRAYIVECLEIAGLLWGWTAKWFWAHSREGGRAATGSMQSFARCCLGNWERIYMEQAFTCRPGPFEQTTLLEVARSGRRAFHVRSGSGAPQLETCRRRAPTWRSSRDRRGPLVVGLCLLVLCCLTLPCGAGRPLTTPKEQRTEDRLFFGMVSGATAKRRGQHYATFRTWMEEKVPDYSLDVLARKFQATLCEWIAEYVVHVYMEGWSRTQAAEMLLSIMDRHGHLRQSLGAAWRLLKSWQVSEPAELHPPCPIVLLKAMVVSSLAWGWFEVATTLLVAFFGLLRPNEYLSLSYDMLSLPEDHSAGMAIFVALNQHKSSRRGPRRTHVRIDEPEVVQFLAWRARTQPVGYYIFGGSTQTWRRRLQQLVANLTGEPRTILPSSLRPGGATHFYHEWGENIPRLQWRGRWACQRTLEHYVQEWAAQRVLHKVPAQLLTRLKDLAAEFNNCLLEIRSAAV